MGRVRQERTSVEADVLDRYMRRGQDGLRTFSDVLMELNGQAAPDSLGQRTGAMGLRADAEGVRVQFPSAEAVPSLIENARRLMINESYPVIVRAAIVHVAILNAHPFTDGNGRTARMIANLILRSGCKTPVIYIPLYEFGIRSRGGFEIALRYAEIFDRWDPILAYFCNVVRLSADLEHCGPERIPI